MLLAFEHYIVMLGTTVLIASTLVPRMGGDYVSLYSYCCLSAITFLNLHFCPSSWALFSNTRYCWHLWGQGDKARVIQSLLFMSGINTLLQTFLGTRLPTVMGASLAFYLPVLSIINDYSDKTFSSEHEVCTHGSELGQNYFLSIHFM